MKTFSTITLITLFSIIVFTFSGCTREKAEQYGQPINNRNLTEIKTVLKDPESFNDKEITIEGKISRECMTGCWFDVQGNGGTVFVNIKPSGLAIPQKVGKEVVVEGKVILRDGQITLIGKGLEIK